MLRCFRFCISAVWALIKVVQRDCQKQSGWQEQGLAIVHNSEITGLRRVVKPEDELQLGQTVNAKIINIDREKLKIGLTIKELEGTSSEYGYEEYISK